MTNQNAMLANQSPNERTHSMNDHDMYSGADIEPVTEHSLILNRLQQIESLTRIGAAATESALNIPHLSEAQDALYEAIYRLASEATFAMEKLEDVSNGLAT